MLLEKPTVESSVRITARDTRTGRSCTMTVYDTDPEAVIDRFKRTLAQDDADASGADAAEQGHEPNDPQPECQTETGRNSPNCRR